MKTEPTKPKTTTSLVPWPVLRILSGYWCRANGYPDRMPMSMNSGGHIYDVTVGDDDVTISIRRNAGEQSNAMDQALRVGKELSLASRQVSSLEDQINAESVRPVPDKKAIDGWRERLKVAVVKRDALMAEYEGWKAKSVPAVETLTVPASVFRDEALTL